MTLNKHAPWLKIYPYLAASFLIGGISLRGDGPLPSLQPHSDLENHLGRVISINEATRVLIVDVRGKRYRFTLATKLLDNKPGKAHLKHLVPGQYVSFLSMPMTDGDLEIVSLFITSGAGGGGGQKLSDDNQSSSEDSSSSSASGDAAGSGSSGGGGPGLLTHRFTRNEIVTPSD